MQGRRGMGGGETGAVREGEIERKEQVRFSGETDLGDLNDVGRMLEW